MTPEERQEMRTRFFNWLWEDWLPSNSGNQRQREIDAWKLQNCFDGFARFWHALDGISVWDQDAIWAEFARYLPEYNGQRLGYLDAAPEKQQQEIRYLSIPVSAFLRGLKESPV